VLEGERALRSHQKLHLSGFPLECRFCLMGFPPGAEGRLAAHRGVHVGGHFECLGCLEEFDSYTRFVKHLEDTAHHEPYRDSFTRSLPLFRPFYKQNKKLWVRGVMEGYGVGTPES
jgi:hypothetical protein